MWMRADCRSSGNIREIEGRRPSKVGPARSGPRDSPAITPPLENAMTVGWIREWGSHAGMLPAIGIAALPKCPLCVMLLFSALGIGHMRHETVFALTQAAILLAVLVLFARRHGRSLPRLALGGAGACGIVLEAGGIGSVAMAWAGAILLAGAWAARSRGGSAAACGCAAMPSTES